jgi:hypothetical protein
LMFVFMDIPYWTQMLAQKFSVCEMMKNMKSERLMPKLSAAPLWRQVCP